MPELSAEVNHLRLLLTRPGPQNSQNLISKEYARDTPAASAAVDEMAAGTPEDRNLLENVLHNAAVLGTAFGRKFLGDCADAIVCVDSPYPRPRLPSALCCAHNQPNQSHDCNHHSSLRSARLAHCTPAGLSRGRLSPPESSSMWHML